MKICFVNSTYFPNVTGGAARNVQILAERLAEDGHTVSVISLVAGRSEPDALVNGVHVHYLRIPNLYWPFDAVRRSFFKRTLWHAMDLFNPFVLLPFMNLMRKLRPDVVNTNTVMGFSTSIFAALRLLKIPHVHTFQDYYMLCQKVSMFKEGRNCSGVCGSCRPYFSIRRKMLKRVNAYTSLSSFLENRHLASGSISEKVPHKIIPAIALESTLVRPRRLDDRAITFGFIGRITESKGVRDVLEAFSSGFGDEQLVVAGGGEPKLTNELVRSYSHRNIEFLGWVEPDVFFKKIDVLVCPSTYLEPLGRVILEAYSHGIPVVCARSGGLVEMIDENETGLVYSPGDVSELKRSMKYIASSPDRYTKMSEACLKKLERYSPKAITESYMEVFNALR